MVGSGGQWWAGVSRTDRAGGVVAGPAASVSAPVDRGVTVSRRSDTRPRGPRRDPYATPTRPSPPRPRSGRSPIRLPVCCPSAGRQPPTRQRRDGEEAPVVIDLGQFFPRVRACRPGCVVDGVGTAGPRWSHRMWTSGGQRVAVGGRHKGRRPEKVDATWTARRVAGQPRAQPCGPVGRPGRRALSVPGGRPATWSDTTRRH